jgi:hypothetical protein
VSADKASASLNKRSNRGASGLAASVFMGVSGLQYGWLGVDGLALLEKYD